jgi:Flp pilus assembly protein TadD/peroxiredoxin
MTSRNQEQNRRLSRRAFIEAMSLAPLFFRPAHFYGASFFSAPPDRYPNQSSPLPFSDLRLTPRYPEPSPLTDVLRLVPPGSDAFITERYATEIEAQLRQWGDELEQSPAGPHALAGMIAPTIDASALDAPQQFPLRQGFGIDAFKRKFSLPVSMDRDSFLHRVQVWLGQVASIDVAEFEIFSLLEISDPSDRTHTVRARIRYHMAATRGAEESPEQREERVGTWLTEWRSDTSNTWKAHRWEAGEETTTVAKGPGFVDVTTYALGSAASYKHQMQHSVDHWRTVLDGAIGVDVYSNNGIAAGDYDNDGFDDLYVCQPAGLPNRLYRNRGDGTFEDVTEAAGVGVLDNTACALFADFDNRDLQDLLVVCGTGPLLFRNQGDGTFALKQNAFQFARPPQGTFTHAAVVDYDRDGRLDIYFCLYMYYLGLDQYHYPIPYYDARNGPPNCLLHNEGNGLFIETTDQAGMNVDNDRYSFSCAWGDSNNNGLPDLFVANDFGSSQLYRNNGNGTFTVVSKEAHVEDVGAGMSCCWADYDNDGHQDVYVPSMWEAAGQRVSEQRSFHPGATPRIRELYQRHARGNALYRNRGDGTFQNVGVDAQVDMGRWSWSSDFWDLDHDGFSDLYVANGYISATSRDDMASFFWRQVVANSSEDSTPSQAYERGWNAINELIRSDSTWHGYARNVCFANNRDGTFSETSSLLGLDFIEDSRSFVLSDLDHDGRLEVVLKNRNAPQLRVLHNSMSSIGNSIAFRLRGRTSNRDAIGASVTVVAGKLHQTKYLQAGSGFLAQHSKELFVGVGDAQAGIRATVRWPSGLIQTFDNIPANHRIEIEEHAASFRAHPFAQAPAGYRQPSPPAKPAPLPSSVETWLVQPLKAPPFSLSSLSGSVHDLDSSQGRPHLLYFWSATEPRCIDQLNGFHREWPGISSSNLNLLAINVDRDADRLTAEQLITRNDFPFPVLFANDETAGVYNLIYRHLFDRRRNLPIPCHFLLDRGGMIVKVYQGELDPQRLLIDLQSMPSTYAERTHKALPFGGTLFHGAFERNDFTYGVAMYQHGYFDQAAESFRQVIAAKPDNADGYYNLGTLSLKRNNTDQARSYLKKTIELRPGYPEAWNNLGMIAAQQGLLDEALEDFQKAVSLRPTFAIAWMNLGNACRRQKNLVKAEEYLRKALALQPDDAEISYSLGMLSTQQNNLAQASDYLQKAILLRPQFAEALNNLGVLFVRTQEFAKAEAQFKSGIQAKPDFDQPYLNLARLYAIQQNTQRARDVLAELLRVQPQNSAARQAMEMLQ